MNAKQYLEQLDEYEEKIEAHKMIKPVPPQAPRLEITLSNRQKIELRVSEQGSCLIDFVYTDPHNGVSSTTHTSREVPQEDALRIAKFILEMFE